MAKISIDRLTLQLSHGTEGDARRLTQLLTRSLAGALEGMPDGEVTDISLSIAAAPGESAERLTARITAELARLITTGKE